MKSEPSASTSSRSTVPIMRARPSFTSKRSSAPLTSRVVSLWYSTNFSSIVTADSRCDALTQPLSGSINFQELLSDSINCSRLVPGSCTIFAAKAWIAEPRTCAVLSPSEPPLFCRNHLTPHSTKLSAPDGETITSLSGSITGASVLSGTEPIQLSGFAR